MGECGCNEVHIKEAFRVGDLILGVEEYMGCKEGGLPLGFAVHLYTPEASKEWYVEAKEDFAPDKYGYDSRSFAFVGKDDLKRAVREDEELSRVKLEDYESLEDLLDDWGLLLLQEAMRRRRTL